MPRQTHGLLKSLIMTGRVLTDEIRAFIANIFKNMTARQWGRVVQLSKIDFSIIFHFSKIFMPQVVKSIIINIV